MNSAVDADGALESISFFINRPVTFVSKLILLSDHTCARQHGAAEAKIFNDAAQFLYRFLRLLQRNQPEGLKARALAEILVVRPVVVGVRQFDSPVAAYDAAERQTIRRVQDGAGQANIFHEIYPALAADLGK